MKNYQDNEEIRFSELCALLGEKPEYLLDLTQRFLKSFDENDQWDVAPQGSRDKILDLLDVMVNDLPLTRDLAKYMREFAVIMIKANEPDFEPDMSSTAEGFDELDESVQALLHMAMLFTSGAEAMKTDICMENNGPLEFPPLVSYMVHADPNDKKELVLENLNGECFDVHLIQLEVINEEDGLKHLSECLAEAFEKYGQPVMIGFTCDTYMREFDSAEVALSEQGQTEIANLEKEYFHGGENVSIALASIVLGLNTPVVTTTLKYHYNDEGQPEFYVGQANYAVDDLSIVTKDKSHRGQVANLFASYIYLGQETH